MKYLLIIVGDISLLILIFNYMPFIKIYVHFVWSTKNHKPLLNSYKLRNQVWTHIRENARNKGIFVNFINGYHNHCHCLVSLGAEQTISNVMKLLKGESSFWINRNKLCKDKFEWQNEYFAVSVSDTLIAKPRNYIKNQEEHHKVKTFQEEYDELMRIYGFG